jgi:hypothetical protein
MLSQHELVRLGRCNSAVALDDTLPFVLNAACCNHLVDLIYSQLYDPTYGPGKISAGFYTQAESLWKAGLGATIEREIARGCKSITIAGHSLGAAVAQLLAVRIEVSR